MPNNRPRLREPPRSRGIPQPSFEELEQALQIDEHELRRCCVHQPELMYQIGRQLAAFESQRDYLKKELTEKEAQVAREARMVADSREIRITVSEVEGAVAMNHSVRQLQDRLLAVGERIGTHKALRDAYIHRKDMLKELVSMHLTDYYSDPIRAGESQNRNIRDQATEGLQRAYRARREQSNQEE